MAGEQNSEENNEQSSEQNKVKGKEQSKAGRKYTIGCGGIFLLTIGFIILKVCRVLEWSWFWVLSPLWLCVALIFVLVLVALISGFFKR